MSKFNELILQTFAAESRLEEEFQKCTQKLDDHVSQSITAGTPVQNKKRPKRLDSIDDGGHDQEHESSSRSSSASGVSKPSQRKTSTQEKQRSLVAAVASTAASVVAPEPPQPIPEVGESSRESSSRPARSTRVKACKSYKEPNISSKMRQPSMAIKQERISMEARKERAEPMELDVENDGNVMNGVTPLEKNKDSEKRKSNDEGFGSTNEKDKEPEDPPAREMSIMMIPQPIPKVEVLSDDEAAEKMPPPSMPPPSMPPPKAKVGRPKKVKNSESFAVSIKREKDAEETSTSAVSSAESTASNASIKSSGRGRKKKDSTKADVGKVQIKSEKLSTDGKDKANKSKTVEKPSVNSPTQSEKSVYEDALDGDTIMRPMVVSLDKMVLGQEPEKNQTFAMDKNGTFNAQSSNGTFVVPSPTVGPDGTFSVKSPEANSTFNVRQLPGPGNNTFVLEKKSAGEQLAHINASIMTEDNSHIEESPEKPPVQPAKKPAVAKKPATLAKTNSKKHNELFSMQSPIKSRIEAFEKAAVASPLNTRTGASRNNTPSQLTRLPSKASTTPLASQRFPASGKSATQTTPTAQNALPLSKGISASASKLAHLQKKPTTASGATVTKSQSLSREPSVERLGTLSAASSSSSLAIDEKKKKREEKQRLAQQQREQMEKEKREHAERLMREKEEKHRKLVQEKEDKMRADLVKKAKKMEEFEKRRHLEELNQRLQAEQKREELVKLEQQQRSERDQAELFKMNQAKENYEIKLHKQMYQQKMQQQQKAQQAQLLQQQQLQLKKVKQSSTDRSDKVYFNFDMIETDDSTDDESSSSSKKTKRPPLPNWCSKEERRLPIRVQSEIKLKVIDQFFSVAPMTPDLREIFPTIDARKLKRNSSAVWRTPPRYSQMPKY